ncbi:D-sedoheptulose-7-phosphate isomerase [Glaesserella parasuis]|uniref:D-sedoheptulose-7-phosphate isomerase n=1 Tax=Glaesserella parasuis TaxID=738 RepID=UPI0021BDA25D|nr:SIS domain-containing protein [Glaesserella parasuis]MCT8573729.1 SIS domain-containing protein [Glaesserella parasuis]MCT8655093.1 SIS domain-containing protein [Glaesserella parasuis]MCT8837194.1 SIS domain-containing protein [Glaesserella parasuis]MDG6310467.1 SIS domain-containing protein [Glaesserella parasuis]MDG6476537.1 SIS domain-containing protein [Glaesserella parasuis]
MLEKIQDRFSESIQIQIAAAELLPKVLNEAANRIVSCLLRGNKVIVCGYGRSYANAQLLVSNLLHRYDLVRPSLSAHLLQFDGMLVGCLNQDQDLNEIFRKQLQVIAKEGDLFIAFSPLGNEQVVLNAIHCANNENLEIFVFTSSLNDHTKGLLDNTDLDIEMPSINEMRIIEGHQFCVNLICELVDNLLFPTTSH